MRGYTKGGVPPCDRRLDRRKVAIAAAAALFLFATSPARADIVQFEIDIAKSFMAQSFTIDASELGAGVHVADPQFAGSDTTTLSGNLFVDVKPDEGVFGKIDIAPLAAVGLSTIEFTLGAPGAGGVPGLYSPADPIFTAPLWPAGIPTFQPGGNYGLSTPVPPGGTLGLRAAFWGMRGELFNAVPNVRDLDALGDFALVPGLAGDLMLGTAGRLAFITALGGDTGELVGDPLAALATAGITKANYLGEVLTIPIESTFVVDIDTDDLLPGSFVHVVFGASGVIVATPFVPEPSSMVLLGFGVVGLLACGWRLRKRRA